MASNAGLFNLKTGVGGVHWAGSLDYGYAAAVAEDVLVALLGLGAANLVNMACAGIGHGYKVK